MSFIFIPETYNGFTAADATQLTHYSISGIFINQQVDFGFRLGNTGSSTAQYIVQASGVNTTVVDDVEFSDDGLYFGPNAIISGVQPNAVSDRIWVRYTPDDGEILGISSFLIRVDET